jgi:hypothetical protein
LEYTASKLSSRRATSRRDAILEIKDCTGLEAELGGALEMRVKLFGREGKHHTNAYIEKLTLRRTQLNMLGRYFGC